MRKFALLSTALPPSQSGQSNVLYHLLKGVDPQKYCLITQKNFHQYTIKPKCSEILPARHFFLQPEYQVVRIWSKLASLLGSAAMLNLVLRTRVYQIKKILQQEQCDGIIACTGDLFDPPAAFIAGHELGLPCILYIFDYYAFQGADPLTRSFAESHEKDLMRTAATVIVPNECMHREYLKRYGIDAVIIHNPFDLGDYEAAAQNTAWTPTLPPRNEKTIVYTGAVYDAHYDAFRNLIEAIKIVDDKHLKVHIYTPQSQIHLIEHNIIDPKVIHHTALPVISMPAIQRSADILFLPLSFDPHLGEIIKTSAPGKIGEYLASNRPILVHAPKGSFVSWYFRKYNCGLVIDKNDPKLLAEAIDRLLHDETFCQEITLNAYLRAKIDFTIESAREKFLTVIHDQ